MPPLPSFNKIKEDVINSQIWRSMFRGGTWKDTSRDRAQHILGNVWLHLHPARIRQRAVRYSYTWGLGGLSFGLFMILTITGILLMFYYRPAVNLAYRDIKDLEFAVSLGLFMRNLHRWSAHAMVLLVILHMIRVFLTNSMTPTPQLNSRGGLYAPVKKTRIMWRMTKSTIAWALHRWRFRMNKPSDTANSKSLISR
jgi:hypothetical protein